MSTVCVLCCSIGYLGLRMLHVQNLCFGKPCAYLDTSQAERAIQEDTTHRKASTIVLSFALYALFRDESFGDTHLGHNRNMFAFHFSQTQPQID